MRTEKIQTASLVYELKGEFADWMFNFREESPGNGLSILHFSLTASRPQRPPELTLSFCEPMKDIQVRWTAQYPAYHHLPPYWWAGGRIETKLCRNAPVFSYMNLEGENRITYAVSDALGTVFTRTGPHESGGVINEIRLFSDPLPPVAELRFAIRIDRRPVHYSDALRGVTAWYAENPAYAPAPVPEQARLPLYSTWYQFQRDVYAEKLEKELELAAKCNLKNVILDDGWNFDGETIPGKFAHAGDWAPAASKFPDMPAHVLRAHELGFKYMVWFPVPFVGCIAKNDFARFKEKFLRSDPECGVLDPRFPEVREYLMGLYERVVREWDLDGLKLDFIDSFHVGGDDRAIAENYAGRDIHSLPEAVDVLLSGIIRRLREIKPEIMIEFRQSYIGPAIRKFGNIFRAADCAFDMLQNRVRTLDLRLLSGNTAVHSDMLIWSKEETPEVAALQILNVIFSTPQISCMLTELPSSHLRMLAFWMSFCMRHRKTLQESKLCPEHPEHSYPVVTAESAEETITALYETDRVVRLNASHRHIVLNATHAPELLIETPHPRKCIVFNTFGEEVSRCEVSGLARVAVPASGFAEFE